MAVDGAREQTNTHAQHAPRHTLHTMLASSNSTLKCLLPNARWPGGRFRARRTSMSASGIVHTNTPPAAMRPARLSKNRVARAWRDGNATVHPGAVRAATSRASTGHARAYSCVEHVVQRKLDGHDVELLTVLQHFVLAKVRHAKVRAHQTSLHRGVASRALLAVEPLHQITQR